MNKQHIALITENLHPDMARKIIKDFKLPFSYLGPSHFTTMVDNMMQVAPEFNEAVDMIVNICVNIPREDQPSFCGYIGEVTDLMVKHILNNTGYQAFNLKDIDQFFPLAQQNIPTGDIYNHENAGKSFISIDLKNAAFQAMKTWDRLYGVKQGYLIGSYINTYKEFVEYIVLKSGLYVSRGELIDNVVIEYVSKCKSLRQVILGKTNPKRIMHIEKSIMQTIITMIRESLDILPVRFNNDEVVYEYNEALERLLYLGKALNHLGYFVHDIATGETSHIKIPMELHKNLYCLEEYSLIQHDDFMPIDRKKPVRFYVKNNMSMLTHTRQVPDFKSLPAYLYLIARALFCSRPDLAGFFENQPVLIDGILHWLAIPHDTSDVKTTWELCGNIQNNESTTEGIK